MTDKEIIIDGYKLEDIKNLLFTGQKISISTKTFEAIIEQFEAKEQECEELKEQLQILDEEDITFQLTQKQFEEYKKLKQALEKIEEIIHNKSIITYEIRDIKTILNKVLKCN